MLLKIAASVLCVAPLAAAAAVAQCAADNCLRALRSPSRLEQALGDCAGYFATTVTPDVVTETQYSTIESTSTVTVDITVVNTMELTATVTVSGTTTITASATTTVVAPLGALKKRDIEPAIPTYASACSGTVRYSSACSCISAVPATMTAVASTTTITLPTTVWVTESMTATATQDVKVTVATVSTTTVVATATVTTAVASASVTPLYLTVSDNYGTFYARYGLPNTDLLFLTPDVNRALSFNLTTDGRIWAGPRTLTRFASGGTQYLRLLRAENLSNSGIAQFQCSLNQARDLMCQIPNYPPGTLATLLFPSGDTLVRSPESLVMHATPADYANLFHPFSFITLKASACLIDSHCPAGEACRQGTCSV
ncbi:hypothetical protein S40293_09340 [Stachybotrys chartarum IBT 40293]|nr:hypothetical protein S40293_09340 [Stachybotrys chartarum IBT 40293]